MILALFFLLLISCASKQSVKPDSQSNLVDLSLIDVFQFNGKMSFSDGHEGGTGQVEWNKRPDITQVKLKAPLSKKSWTLIDSKAQAKIQLSNGEEIYGLSANQLISDQVGWEVPWKALQSWVIGQKTQSGMVLNQNESADYVIVDQGWRIEYTKLKPYAAGMLPHKIIARKEPYSIKLIVKQWQW